jgi:hypothetical protein
MGEGCGQDFRNKLQYELERDEASLEKKEWHAKSERERGGWKMGVLR